MRLLMLLLLLLLLELDYRPTDPAVVKILSRINELFRNGSKQQ